ncbi:MAG: PIN domain-containing protein [Candidatus Omnitrophica bacterium]|nr:PIN domain-containing protein [Candidatus Omnitrophota bacterium]
MITAVDTNVLLDLLLQDPSFGTRSEEALRDASKQGALIICDVVYAELAGLFPSQAALEAFLRETSIQLKSSSPEILWKAGELWRRFCLDRPRQTAIARRIIADFLIGAHAMLQAEQFLTRDKDFYRAVFSGLRLAHP